MKSAKTFDAQGLKCPMPVLKLAKIIREVEHGEILEVIADDPGFKPDIKAWCNQTKHELVYLEEEGKVMKAYIKKV